MTKRLEFMKSGDGFFGKPDPFFDPNDKTIRTVSAVAFDFDFVTSDPSKSRADEIRILVPKNKKPSRNSKERKPGGFGLPTGQLESQEAMLHAVERETEDETGCPVRKIVGKFFVVQRKLRIDDKFVPNEINVYLIEASGVMHRVRESDEIDPSVDPWISLRQVFEMPFAQDKSGSNRNPNGIYFSHLLRLYCAIDSMVFDPGDLVDGEPISQWLKPNRRALIAAMIDIERAGLLERLFSSE